MKIGILALVVGLLATFDVAAAHAQSAVSEIVVTAERRAGIPQVLQGAEAPHVTLIKRADNLIVSVRVVCDTRDLSQRRDELKQTLANMIRTAADNPQIELGLGTTVIGRFDATMFDAVIQPDDDKVDTSFAVVVVKTHVTAADTFDSATGRIKAFIDKTPKVGRTELLRDDSWSLTIIGPEQYRGAIIAKLADDARATAAAFGAGYGVSVSGLEKPVDWRQSGPLDLALFIPYELTIQPAR